MSDAAFRALAEEFAARLAENQKAFIRLLDTRNGIDPDNRPTVMVEQPLDPEWLEQRSAFAARWEQLRDEGLDAGFLDYEHCYECGGELEVTRATTEWVQRPNPDFDPVKPNPYRLPEGASITIPVPRQDPPAG